MAKPKPARTLLKQAIARCNEKLAAWEGDRSPQIIEMKTRVTGEKMAFEAVRNDLDLRIYADG